MKVTSMESLLSLLGRLKESNINYRLDQYRLDAVSVHVAVPGERWEIDVFEDGRIEVERFLNPQGEIGDGSALDVLFEKYSEKT